MNDKYSWAQIKLYYINIIYQFNYLFFKKNIKVSMISSSSI